MKKLEENLAVPVASIARDGDTEKYQHPDRQVWTVCDYLRQDRDEPSPCHECPAWFEDKSYGRCKRMCRALAEEMINIVETGDAWRRRSTSPWQEQGKKQETD